jgi:hypothetical protein
MPDLMGAAHASPGNADGTRRILAHLEHGPRAQARPARAWNLDGWSVGLVLLLLTMCGVAWLMHEETITPVTFKSQRSSSARHEVAAAPAAAQESRHARPQAAAIINTPHAVLPPPLAPMPEIPAAQQSQPAAPRSIPDRATNHKFASTPRPKPVIEVTQTRPAPASDTDVTLLTALVAHAGQPASVTPERTRDVVERRDGDRTADLLLRCKQLGLMEGMLCRSRICSGSWESDAACRAPAN